MAFYEILWGDSTSDLCEKVQNGMNFGWVPLGGVCNGTATTMGQKRDILLQAMIKDN
jgi:hypothetical protein